MAELREISCPICDSPQAQIVGRPVHVSRVARLVVPPCDDIRIVQCRECSFYYTAPMPFWNDDDLDILYSAEYFPEPTDWWIARRRAGASNRLYLLGQAAQKAEPVFLDVGCGYGHVLEEAVELGWQTYGLEPSSALAAQAQERVGRLATIHIEPLEKTTFPADSFHAIHMDSVLEHVPEPKSAVRMLHRLLKVGGVAYVLVPNEDRLAYIPSEVLLRLKQQQEEETPRLSPLCNPYHIVGFNKRSFYRLFQETGFRVRYSRVFRGTEPWKKMTEAVSDRMSLKGRAFQAIESLFWDIGGLLGRGTMIEGIWEKTTEYADPL